MSSSYSFRIRIIFAYLLKRLVQENSAGLYGWIFEAPAFCLHFANTTRRVCLDILDISDSDISDDLP
jgi:hypothetical protein